MSISSGRHELFADLELGEDASHILEADLESKSFSNRFDERDARWAVEAMALADGRHLLLYEEIRSNYTLVEERARFVDYLVERADKGRAVLQHREAGTRVIEWTIKEAVAARTEKSVKSPRRVPKRVAPAMDRFARVVADQEARLEARSPAEKFEEVAVRYAPTRPGIVVCGGNEALRGEALRRLADAMGGRVRAWQPGAAIEEGAIVLVERLDDLSHDAQGALHEALAEGRARVLAACAASPRALVEEEKLRVELYYRLSAGQVDLDHIYPEP